MISLKCFGCDVLLFLL